MKRGFSSWCAGGSGDSPNESGAISGRRTGTAPRGVVKRYPRAVRKKHPFEVVGVLWKNYTRDATTQIVTEDFARPDLIGGTSSLGHNCLLVGTAPLSIHLRQSTSASIYVNVVC